MLYISYKSAICFVWISDFKYLFKYLVILFIKNLKIMENMTARKGSGSAVFPASLFYDIFALRAEGYQKFTIDSFK